MLAIATMSLIPTRFFVVCRAAARLRIYVTGVCVREAMHPLHATVLVAYKKPVWCAYALRIFTYIYFNPTRLSPHLHLYRNYRNSLPLHHGQLADNSDQSSDAQPSSTTQRSELDVGSPWASSRELASQRRRQAQSAFPLTTVEPTSLPNRS